MSAAFTLLDEGVAHSVEATVSGDRVYLGADVVAGVLGWSLKDEGLCRGDVCVPVRDRSALVTDRGLDLAALAEALGRPLALDSSEAAAALGTAARVRADQLTTLEAPDFSLPDLAGRMHSLSDYRGKKVLLIAYASW
jgi:hypothetical protein